MPIKNKIAIIDYDMGNLASVHKAFEHIGFPSVITDDPELIRLAAGVVLPGVGAFGDGIANLTGLGLVPVIKQLIAQEKPFLGICLGMHLLMEESFENGCHQGLGILKGKVVRFEHQLKIPQIGWNSLQFKEPSPIFAGLEPEPYLYFVHSYYVLPEEESLVSSTTDYGYPFVSSLCRKNLFATQFHPEKSQAVGLSILRNFARTCLAAGKSNRA